MIVLQVCVNAAAVINQIGYIMFEFNSLNHLSNEVSLIRSKYTDFM